MTIDELIAFVEAHVPGFSKRIVGADDEVLVDLKNTARHALPKLYWDYMNRMGLDPSDFRRERWKLHPIAVSDAASIAEGDYPRERFTLLALHAPTPHEPRENWYFDHGQAEMIVKFEIGVEVPTPVYSSFEELLVSWIGYLFCLDPFAPYTELQFAKRQTDRSQTDDGQSACRALAQGKLGFEQVLSASDYLWLGRRGSTNMMIRTLLVPDVTCTFVRLAGPDKPDVSRVAELMRDNLR